MGDEFNENLLSDEDIEEGIDLDEVAEEESEETSKNPYGRYEPYSGNGVLTKFDPPTLDVDNKRDKIFDYYNTGEFTLSNVVLVDGKVKQFVYNNETYDVMDSPEILRIGVQQDKSKSYVLDTDKLNSIIKTIMCGK